MRMIPLLPFPLLLAACNAAPPAPPPPATVQVPAEAPPASPDTDRLDALLADLDSDDIAVRRAARHALFNEKAFAYCEPAALRLLRMHRESPLSHELRTVLLPLLEWAAGASKDDGRALVDLLRDPVLFDIALELMHREVPGGQLLAARALAAHRRRPEVRSVVQRLSDRLAYQDDGARWIRLRTPLLLALINYPGTYEILVTFSRDRDPMVRSAVAEALGMTGDSRALEKLTAILWDEDDHFTRVAAVRGLLALGDVGADHLRLLLHDRAPSPDHRHVLAYFLAQLYDPRARQLLEEAARAPDPEVRCAGAAGLREVARFPSQR